MGNRLSKIVTRTGDDGSTGLADGSRVPKESARIEACGTVDELNSSIGVLLAQSGLPEAMSPQLLEIQHDLFDLGCESSCCRAAAPRPRTATWRARSAAVPNVVAGRCRGPNR